MIYDRIENRHNYKGLVSISRALEYLSHMSLETAPQEKTYLDGEDLIANPLAFVTKPAEECVFEAHRRYIDVHYCLSGTEAISIASPIDLKETSVYDPDKDTIFYEGQSVSTSILTPGTFMVCFPEDVHRTGITAESTSDIRKLVIKVTA